MCAPMCALNRAGAYRPSPEEVASSTTRQPASHATVRPTGQWSPLARSRRTPTR